MSERPVAANPTPRGWVVHVATATGIVPRRFESEVEAQRFAANVEDARYVSEADSRTHEIYVELEEAA